MASASCLLHFAVVVGLVAGASLPGVVELDEYNFDRLVLNRHFDVLVKFDKEYTFGRPHEMFKDVVEQLVAGGAATREDFLVATLPVKEYGDMMHADIAKKYGVDLETMPSIKLFRKNGEIVTFTDDINRDGDLANFVKFECGVYLNLEGTIEEFEPLAFKFTQAADKQAVIAEARELAEEYGDAELEDSAIYYVKVMEKLLATPNYATTEISRVKKVLGGKVSMQKKVQMVARINILSSFLSKAASWVEADL